MLQFFSVYLGLIFLWSHWDTRVQIARILLGYCPRIFPRFSKANGTRAERCDRSNFQWRWGHIQLLYAYMRRFVANYPPPFILKKNVLILIILLLNIVISRHRWSLLVIQLIWDPFCAGHKRFLGLFVSFFFLRSFNQWQHALYPNFIINFRKTVSVSVPLAKLDLHRANRISSIILW